MKQASDLINLAKKDIGKVEQEKRKESGSIINHLFYNLKLIFPAWRQNFKTENEFNLTKSLWLESLIDESITTQEQIERGLKGARNHDSAFFPSIGQFIKWTKEEAPRVNEQAYKPYQPKLPKHTRQEYSEIAESGASKLRKELNIK